MNVGWEATPSFHKLRIINHAIVKRDGKANTSVTILFKTKQFLKSINPIPAANQPEPMNATSAAGGNATVTVESSHAMNGPFHYIRISIEEDTNLSRLPWIPNLSN